MYSTFVDLAHARHSADWARWQALTAGAPPFLQPEFFQLASGFGDEESVVVEAWDEQEMVGVLPLRRDGDRLHALRCDYTPGYDYWGANEGIDAIWQNLHAEPRWRELELSKVPVSSPLATRLPALAVADGCAVAVKLDSRHPYFALRGFEAAMSPKFRSNLQRCARKAGGVELERIEAPDREAFDEAIAIEAMAWKGAAGTSIEADPRATHLYRALSKLVGRRHRGALYFLRVRGKRMATLFAVEDGHTLYALKIGYDPAYANLSPGHLLIWRVAAEAEARGLQELNFVGREDDWKRKWTDRVHEHVTLLIYRGPTGLARYAVRHLVRPHLPASVRGGLRDLVPRHCQKDDLIGAHTLVGRVRGRVAEGLGIKSGVKKLVRPPPVRDPVGEPSSFEAGSWVRVRSAEQLRATLDEHDKTRGLLFTGAQWDTAGQIFQVAKQVRRMRDDRGVYRPIARTVLLDGVDCAGHGGEPAGCGRHCPMMYRDEWLEPAPAPPRGPTQPSTARHARVKNLEDIEATLDLRGRHDGLTFMPEMEAHCGKRFAIANTIMSVFEYDRWVTARTPVYILDGARCTGEITGGRGPCDRSCSLLWHPDWLVIEPA